MSYFPCNVPAAKKIVLTATKKANHFAVAAYKNEFKLEIDGADNCAHLSTKNGKRIGTVRAQKDGTFSSCTTKGAYDSNFKDAFEATKRLISLHLGTPYLF